MIWFCFALRPALVKILNRPPLSFFVECQEFDNSKNIRKNLIYSFAILKEFHLPFFLKMIGFRNENPVKQNLTGGPHGLGDPNDRSLRKVEKEVLIPKVMRDLAKIEKCHEEVKQFESCCKDNGLLMIIKCRQENNTLKSCLSKWYQDDKFRERCTEIYLKDRSEFRQTGIPKKHRALEQEQEKQ